MSSPYSFGIPEVKPSVVLPGTGSSVDDSKLTELFDRDTYMRSAYELRLYRKLRPPSSFAAGQLFNKDKAIINF